MARPKSEDKRKAIMAAAIHVIVKQGLSAPTAAIAKEAGVANGSLFTYFETKADLFSQLYLELKTEMATASMKGLPAKAGVREQLFHGWAGWIRWAVGNPEKRRALSLLGMSDEISPTHRAAGHQTMAGVAMLMERVRVNGALRDTQTAFAGAIMNSLAEATIDFMVQDPSRADKHLKVGFDALWRVVG